MAEKDCKSGQGKISMCQRKFKCTVVRYADTNHTQVGNEILTAKEIAKTVDGRRGGTYLTVYGVKSMKKLTPITLEYKGDAKKWAKKVCPSV